MVKTKLTECSHFIMLQGETSVHFIEVKNDAPHLNPGNNARNGNVWFVEGFCIDGNFGCEFYTFVIPKG